MKTALYFPRSFFRLYLISIICLSSLSIAAQSISTGSNHAMFICTDRSIVGAGNNFYGPLGNASYIPNDGIQELVSGEWKMVACGGAHTLFLKSDSTLWVTGHGGWLGLGDYDQRDTPTQVGTDNDWVYIEGGYYTGFAIKSDGAIYSFGYNLNGQLGLGSIAESLSPAELNIDVNCVKVAAFAEHAIALSVDSMIWGWGENLNGELGDGNSDLKFSPEIVSPKTNWIDIAVGGSHSLAIDDNGWLYGTGLNNLGQLGLGESYSVNEWTVIDSINSYIDMAGGAQHTLLIRDDHTLWAAGRNDVGQLGIGNLVHNNTFVQVGDQNDWMEVEAFDHHSIAKTSDGTIYIWGDNSEWNMPGCNTHGTGICVIPTMVSSPCNVVSAAVTIENGTEIIFYPVPSYNELHFKGVPSFDRISIFDISGRIVHRLQQVDGMIDISGIKSGHYFIEAHSKHSVYRQSFIKL